MLTVTKRCENLGLFNANLDVWVTEIESLRAKVVALGAENATLHEQVDLQIPKLAFDQLNEKLTVEREKVRVLVDALEEARTSDPYGICKSGKWHSKVIDEVLAAVKGEGK